MQIETINKLYLELSQVATAETQKENELRAGIATARTAALQLCREIEKCGASKRFGSIYEKADALWKQLNDPL